MRRVRVIGGGSWGSALAAALHDAGNDVAVLVRDEATVGLLAEGRCRQLADICRQAGVPKGVVNIVTGDGRVGEMVVAHAEADKVAFTGSTEVGRAIRDATAGQGKALNDHAADDIRITVTGNPANTNALIAMSNAPDIPAERFSALTRLDHNRAIAQLAAKVGAPVTDVSHMTIWGNHSATQYPDLFHAQVGGRNAAEAVGDQQWIEDTFIPTVAKRGAAIIEARGSSSAASAASATIDHARDWLRGSPEGDWVSMAVRSDGSYGVEEGIMSSFPVTTRDGSYEIVQGLDIDDFSRGRIDASVAELVEEKAAVTELGLI